MARIRIVDEWLRSPASTPIHARAVMVVAEKWAEQRVLMRAYADSRDQTRPTIVLHGAELAIGPASLDAHGPWGVHVPAASAGGSHDDGTAQSLCAQLELAARRLAGSRGNPARLADEESTFERDITGNWAPGTPRSLPGTRPPSMVRLPAAAQVATFVPSLQAAEVVPASPVPAPPVVSSRPATSDGLRKTPVPRAGGRTRGPSKGPAARTALGYQSGAGAQSALVRLGLSPAVSARLGRLSARTLSTDFQLTRAERDVLNAIGDRGPLSAREIGALLSVADPVGWMESLLSKLEGFGLDLVEPGEPRGGEPTYQLRG
ncbi:MAG: hypothetical protein R2939_04715 [Kofleriaceae bacterium]